MAEKDDKTESTPESEGQTVSAPEGPVAPAAQPPVRDSGPVKGASGEPEGSPEGDAGAAEESGPAEPGEQEAAEAAETPAGEVPAAEEAEAAAETVTPARKPKRKRVPRAQRRQRTKPKRERPAERKPITRLPKPEKPRGRRQERRGVVVSSAMDKTIVVKVDTVKAHPRYKKVVRRSTKFHAHDEQNAAKVGDVVRIIETRPLSKTKYWRLAEVVEAAR